MSDLIDTTEMYLRVIAELEEEGTTPMRARIAERFDQASPTVSQTVARMERDGLVVVNEDRSLSLTKEGRHRAIAVLRRHRLAECLLINMLGISLDRAHEQACRWEHVLTEEVERSICAKLGHPNVTPYGTLIPGLDDIGEDHCLRDETPLTAADEATIGLVTVLRLGENIQSYPDLLTDVISAGIVPGTEVTLSRRGTTVILTRGEESVSIPAMAAHAISVR